MNLLNQSFDAYAFGPDWGSEMVGGTLLLTMTDLRFDFPGGSIVIPIGRLKAEVRPGDEERIAFTDFERPGLEIFTAEMELLDCTALPPLVQAREALVARLSNRELKRRLRILAYCVLACVLLTFLGSVVLGFMVRSIARNVPSEWDDKFLAMGMGELGVAKDAPSDTNLVAQMETLAAPLLAVVPRPVKGYTFHIVPDPEPNACALPGGHIVINSGLLTVVKQPEELLGVLAHEIAHVTERHSYREMIGASGPMIICQAFFGRSSGMGRVLGGGAALMIGAGFSQEYETEADDVGWDFLIKANIDPRGMIHMFETFQALEGKSHFAGPQAFSSHPALPKRIKRLEGKWKKVRQTGGFIELPALPKAPSIPGIPSDESEEGVGRQLR